MPLSVGDRLAGKLGLLDPMGLPVSVAESSRKMLGLKRPSRVI
jgi:hypothetical protein